MFVCFLGLGAAQMIDRYKKNSTKNLVPACNMRNVKANRVVVISIAKTKRNWLWLQDVNLKTKMPTF